MAKKTKLPVLQSGHFTAECPRQVFHRERGEVSREAPTALFRGSLVGAAVQHVHEADEWEYTTPCMMWARASLEETLAEEGRTPTDSVFKNLPGILKEVETVVGLYQTRMGPLFKRCKFIGCELAVNVQIGGRLVKSHLDLLVRDPENVFKQDHDRLIIIDGKWTKEAPCLDFESREWKAEWPSVDYVARHQQLAIYELGVHEGSIQTDASFDIWTEFGEWPAAALIHYPSLKPFKRATPTYNHDGSVAHTFQAGDERPMKNIVRWTGHRLDRRDTLIHDLNERATMYEHGLYPKIPGPVRCMTCDAKEWCTRGDQPE